MSVVKSYAKNRNKSHWNYENVTPYEYAKFKLKITCIFLHKLFHKPKICGQWKGI